MVAEEIGDGARLEPNGEGVLVEGCWISKGYPVGSAVVELHCEAVGLDDISVVGDLHTGCKLLNGKVNRPIEHHICL